VSFTEGSTMDRVFLTLLSMCPEFYSKVSRKQDPLDPDSDVKTDQAYVSWFRILGDTKQLAYDPVRNDYAYEYTYTPVLYKTPRTDVAVDTAEAQPLNNNDAEARLSQIIANGGLQKSYQYMFTGLNDQIIRLDIKHDNGVALLVAPKGGAIGDSTITDPSRFSAQAEADQDMTLEGTVRDVMNKVNDKVNLDKVTGFFDKVAGLLDEVSDASTSLTQSLGDVFGKSPDEIKSILKGEAAITAADLVNSLDSATLKKIATDAQISEQQVSTEDPTVINNGGGGSYGAYSPAISGYAYSADILSVEDLTGEINAEDLVKQGYLTLTTAEVSEATTVKQKIETSQDVPNATSSATYKAGSPRNTLFGFLVNQNASKAFLTSVDMTVRGDPWYLGGPGYDASTKEYANYFKDDNCFWLEIRSPITYDPDWSDEDSFLNSGYWRYDGVSRSFSGLYRITTVYNNFSGGIYSVDVEGMRVGVDASNIERKSPVSTTQAAATQASVNNSETEPRDPADQGNTITADQTQALLALAQQNAANRTNGGT
jgi:hypothetical protein